MKLWSGFCRDLKDRSPRAREEFARSLMVLGNTAQGALFAAILVLPLSLVIQGGGKW